MDHTTRFDDDHALATALEAHRARLAACTACEDAGVAPGARLPGAQPILSLARAPRVMLVGQAPGKTEVGTARPFSGRAGRTLFRWLATAGIEEPWFREHVYMAAVTRCFPGPHPSGRGDRVPSPRERVACGPWLDAELAMIRPRVLILVGRLAIDRFLGAQPLDALVGRVHDVAHAGGTSRAIPLPHPSGASSWVHAPGHDRLLAEGLERLGEEVRRAAPTLARAVAVGAMVLLAAMPVRAQGAAALPEAAGPTRVAAPAPPAPRPRLAADQWVGADKVKHFFLAGFVQGVAHSGSRATGTGARSSLAVAGTVTALVSVGKEWHDRRTTGFSARDLVWDAAGAGTMTLLLRRTAR